MEKGRKIGSLEFVIILIIIFLVAIAGWFFWYLPAQNRITVNVYKIAMNSARTAADKIQSRKNPVEDGPRLS